MQTEMAKKSGFIRLKNGTVFRALSGAERKRRDWPRRNAEDEVAAFVPDAENGRVETAGVNLFDGICTGVSRS